MNSIIKGNYAFRKKNINLVISSIITTVDDINNVDLYFGIDEDDPTRGHSAGTQKPSSRTGHRTRCRCHRESESLPR